jgi:hypothetical protein
MSWKSLNLDPNQYLDLDPNIEDIDPQHYLSQTFGVLSQSTLPCLAVNIADDMVYKQNLQNLIEMGAFLYLF